MGHADEATTLRIYGHLMPGRDAAAAQLFSEAKRRAAGVYVGVPIECQYVETGHGIDKYRNAR